MAVPVWQSNGTAAEADGADPAPGYPAGIVAGDLLLLQVFARDATGTAVTPSGWTLIYGPDAGVGASWVFAKKATGSETGTQTVDVTVAAGTLVLAVIHRFTGWFDNGTITDAFEGGANGSDFTTTEAHQACTTTGADRLIVALRRCGNPVAANMDAYTGANVTWTHVFEYESLTANDGTIGCDTAPAAAAITASGGTDVISGAAVGWGNRVFAIKPAAGATPVNTVAPVASGTKTQGSTLSCTTGTWDNAPTSYAYQWQRDVAGNGVYSNISGATASTYVLTADDVGDNVRCVVTATNASGSTAANSNALGLIGPLYTGSGTVAILICGSGTGSYSVSAGAVVLPSQNIAPIVAHHHI